MSAWIIDLGVRGLSPNTTERYARACELFKRFLGKRLKTFSLAIITRDDLRNFYKWLLEPANGLHGQQRSVDTARKNVEPIQLLWKHGFEEDTTGRVPPLKALKMAREIPPPPTPPTFAELDQLIASIRAGRDAKGRAKGINERLYRRAVLMRGTGLRIEQAQFIEVEHINFTECTLRVVRGKSRQEKRGRIVPIPKWLVEEIQTWGVRSGYLIPGGERGGNRERMARARDMARAWKVSGVRPSAWESSPHHCFRDGYQSGLKKLGADDEAVKFLVGHSLGLRGRYVGGEFLPLREAVDLVPPMNLNVVVLRTKEKAS